MGSAMSNYILLSYKSWNDALFYELKGLSDNWTRIRTKEEFTPENLKKLLRIKYLSRIGLISFQLKYITIISVWFFI